MEAIDQRFLVSPDLFEHEADYLLGRCLPLLDILRDNEQARQLRKDIVAYATQAGGVNSAEGVKKMSGAELIAVERQRQIESEGWTPEHDDEHCMGEMIGAAITYAGHALGIVSDFEIDGADAVEYWAWDKEWWKPSIDPIRNLVKAGALIAAEIDRLQRLAAKS